MQVLSTLVPESRAIILVPGCVLCIIKNCKWHVLEVHIPFRDFNLVDLRQDPSIHIFLNSKVILIHTTKVGNYCYNKTIYE